MMGEIKIGEYVLDTLQIYFPWDDDLYSALLSKGFGRISKKLPLIYTDNTEVTTGEKERRRKYVIEPYLFGRTYSELGWRETDNPTQPIIPAEKPLLRALYIDGKLKLVIVPTVNGKEQYHLEYSPMSAFGKMYSNWVGIYLSLENFTDVLCKVKKHVILKAPATLPEVKTEPIMQQREEMHYVKLPIIQYKFCLAGFSYAVDFLQNNGVWKSDIPCLFYDAQDATARKRMEPYVKLGIVHTRRDIGFEERRPQVAIKIAQDKVVESARGKRCKPKGILIYEGQHENYLLLDAESFVIGGEVLIRYYKTLPVFSSWKI
jgi:hypothetical protein